MNIEELVFELKGFYFIQTLPIDEILSVVENWIEVKPIKLKKFILVIDEFNYYYYNDQLMALRQYLLKAGTNDHMFLINKLEDRVRVTINHFKKYKFAQSGDAWSSIISN